MAGERSLGMFKAMMHEILTSDKVSEIVYGTVKTVKPVTVELENRLTLTPEFLVLSPFCYKKELPHPTVSTDPAGNQPDHSHTVPLGVSSEDGGEADHSHSYTTPTHIVWPGLFVGDKVVLIRAMKGQRYFVLWKDGEI